MTEISLPPSWAVVPLADLGEWRGGGTPTKGNPSYWNGDIPWASPKDMKVHRLRITKNTITREAMDASATSLIPEQSIVMVTRSGILSHSFPVATTDIPIAINQDLKALIPYRGIDPQYLAWALRAKQRDILSKCSKHGTTVHSIEMPRLHAFRIPIAPIAEQRRIVAKVEELMSKLDKGIDNCEVARAQLGLYRLALLNAAFQGKLTAAWRDEEKGNLQTGWEIRSCLESERRQQNENDLGRWRAAIELWERGGQNGPKPVKPRAVKTMRNLSGRETEGLPDLPEGWLWERLGWMTCGVEYGSAAKSAPAGKVAVLRMGNIQNAKLDWSHLVFTSDEEEIASYQLHPGDVLFNRTNSPELVGKTAIYRGEYPAIFAGYLIRVNHIPRVVDGQYLNLFLNSHVARVHGNRVKTDGVNQSNINGDKLVNYPFPYCSLQEQREVVRILEERLSIIDDMTSQITSELLRAQALRQTILTRAFAGLLLPQNPSDEPAALLLERIVRDIASGAGKDSAKKWTRAGRRRKAVA